MGLVLGVGLTMDVAMPVTGVRYWVVAVAVAGAGSVTGLCHSCAVPVPMPGVGDVVVARTVAVAMPVAGHGVAAVAEVMADE